MTREEKNLLFPLILDTLFYKPLNCDTEVNIWKDIQTHLNNNGVAIKQFKKQFQEAVEIGKDLGILRVEGNALRMTRLYKTDEMVAPSTSRKRGTTNIRRASNHTKSPSRRRSRSRSGSRAHSRSNSRSKRKSR